MKKLAQFLAPLALLAGASLFAQAQAPAPTREQAMQMQQMMMAQQMQMMAAMYDLRKSRLGFEETVTAIKTGAEKRGWKLGEVVDMQAEMRKAGAKDARRMKVVNLCPAGANERVAKASGGKAPPLHCRATVFEGADGTINVVRLNLHTLAKGMQGDLSKVLGELAAEEDALYKSVLD
jgi:uncharacterized protein (DUF302 family)